MKYLLVLFFVLSCTGAPVIRSDTRHDQENAKHAAFDLSRVNENPSNVITPQDRAAIVTGGRVLDQCAATLAEKDKEVNACGKMLAQCKADYIESQENGGSFWTRLKGLWKELLCILTAFGIGTAFGRVIIAAAWGAVRGALRI